MYYFVFVATFIFSTSLGWGSSGIEVPLEPHKVVAKQLLEKYRQHFDNLPPEPWTRELETWKPCLSDVDETKTHDSPIDLETWKAKLVRWAEKWPKAKLTQYIETTTRMFNALLGEKKDAQPKQSEQGLFSYFGKKAHASLQKIGVTSEFNALDPKISLDDWVAYQEPVEDFTIQDAWNAGWGFPQGETADKQHVKGISDDLTQAFFHFEELRQINQLLRLEYYATQEESWGYYFGSHQARARQILQELRTSHPIPNINKPHLFDQTIKADFLKPWLQEIRKDMPEQSTSPFVKDCTVVAIAAGLLTVVGGASYAIYQHDLNAHVRHNAARQANWRQCIQIHHCAEQWHDHLVGVRQEALLWLDSKQFPFAPTNIEEFKAGERVLRSQHVNLYTPDTACFNNPCAEFQDFFHRTQLRTMMKSMPTTAGEIDYESTMQHEQ